MTDALIVNMFLIPFVAGVVIPFLTNWTTAHGFPVYVETLLNVLLSAGAGALITVTFNGDWQQFLLAFGVAWVGALRSHYLGAAQAIYSPRKGRHELAEQDTTD